MSTTLNAHHTGSEDMYICVVGLVCRFALRLDSSSVTTTQFNGSVSLIGPAFGLSSFFNMKTHNLRHGQRVISGVLHHGPAQTKYPENGKSRSRDP